MKTSNIVVRIEPDIKLKAEAVLDHLGLSASSIINALYHQIIYTKGVPFSMSIPTKMPSLDDMSEEEAIEMLNNGIKEAESGNGLPAEKAFDEIKKNIDAHEKIKH